MRDRGASSLPSYFVKKVPSGFSYVRIKVFKAVNIKKTRKLAPDLLVDNAQKSTQHKVNGSENKTIQANKIVE